MILQIALDTPLRRVFDYLPPQRTRRRASAAPGVRVLVPFGRQRLIGILVGIASESSLSAARSSRPRVEIPGRAAGLRSRLPSNCCAGPPITTTIRSARCTPPRCPPPCAPASLPPSSTEHWSLTEQGREELAQPSIASARRSSALCSPGLRIATDATADEIGESFKPALLKPWRARGWIERARSPRPPGSAPMQIHPGGSRSPARKLRRSKPFAPRCRISACTCSMA